jgi:hypothetical protein
LSAHISPLKKFATALYRELHDPCVRALWTALEAFLGVIVGSGVMSLDVSVLEAAGVAALSGVLTVALAYVRQKRIQSEGVANPE